MKDNILIAIALFGLIGGFIASLYCIFVNPSNPSPFAVFLMVAGLPLFLIAGNMLDEEQQNDS